MVQIHVGQPFSCIITSMKRTCHCGKCTECNTFQLMENTRKYLQEHHQKEPCWCDVCQGFAWASAQDELFVPLKCQRNSCLRQSPHRDEYWEKHKDILMAHGHRHEPTKPFLIIDKIILIE